MFIHLDIKSTKCYYHLLLKFNMFSKIKKYNVDINNEVNGVYLPTTDMGNGNGIKHSGKHPQEYIEAINKKIFEADNLGGEAGFLNELKNIEKILRNANCSTNWRHIL